MNKQTKCLINTFNIYIYSINTVNREIFAIIGVIIIKKSEKLTTTVYLSTIDKKIYFYLLLLAQNIVPVHTKHLTDNIFVKV